MKSTALAGIAASVLAAGLAATVLLAAPQSSRGDTDAAHLSASHVGMP